MFSLLSPVRLKSPNNRSTPELKLVFQNKFWSLGPGLREAAIVTEIELSAMIVVEFIYPTVF